MTNYKVKINFFCWNARNLICIFIASSFFIHWYGSLNQWIILYSQTCSLNLLSLLKIYNFAIYCQNSAQKLNIHLPSSTITFKIFISLKRWFKIWGQHALKKFWCYFSGVTFPRSSVFSSHNQVPEQNSMNTWKAQLLKLYQASKRCSIQISSLMYGWQARTKLAVFAELSKPIGGRIPPDWDLPLE